MASKKIFERFDKDKDGKLSLDEFREVALIISPLISQQEIVNVFKAIDLDGDGKLNVDEFTGRIDKMLKEAFEYADTNGDGKISGKDFYNTMTRIVDESKKEKRVSMVQDVDEERCDAIVEAMDADGDGYLNFEEFEAMICDCVVPRNN